MDKTFTFEHLVYLNETNAIGGVVYFSNYVKWQGMVREAFFIGSIPEWNFIMQESLQGRLSMMTVEEHSQFKHHAFFGDEIVIKAVAKDIQKFNFKIMFEMFKKKDGIKIYEGWQKIAFDDCKGHFLPIPEPFLKAALDHASSEEIAQYKERYSTSSDRLLKSLTK